MGIKLQKYEIRAAMKENLLLPDWVMGPAHWRGTNFNSRIVFMSFFHQVWNTRPRELRPDVARDLPNRSKCARP